MLSKIHPKYTLVVTPKEGTEYNPVHDETNGATATVIDLAVGKRGWIAYCHEGHWGWDYWHRLHTSFIKNINVDEETGDIAVETENTIYVLLRIKD